MRQDGSLDKLRYEIRYYQIYEYDDPEFLQYSGSLLQRRVNHALLEGSVFAWMVMDYGLEEEPRSFGGGPRYYAYYRCEEMKALLRRAGFRALALESCPGRVFGEEIVQVWAQKP